jgi:hypothetical protein
MLRSDKVIHIWTVLRHNPFTFYWQDKKFGTLMLTLEGKKFSGSGSRPREEFYAQTCTRKHQAAILMSCFHLFSGFHISN